MSVDMKVVPVPADGDCLYHAFIKGLDIPGLTPQQLRDFVADKILNEKDLYDDLVTEWVDFNVINDIANITPQIAAHHLRTTKEWATSTVIHILATAFNVRIVVYQKINGEFFPEIFPSQWKTEDEKREPERAKPYKDIHLLRRGYHFELLLPVDEQSLKTTASETNTKQVYHKNGGQRGGGIMIDNGNFDSNTSTVIMGLVGVLLLLFTI